MERAQLERRLRHVWALASVLAEAPGASYVPSGHGQLGHREPTTGAGGNLADRLKARLELCGPADGGPVAASEVCRVLRWAEREIEHATRRTLPEGMPFRQRILVEWYGEHYRVVSRATNTAPSTVRRWRKEAGLAPLDGRLLGGPQ
jgi:hypothetical protein